MVSWSQQTQQEAQERGGGTCVFFPCWVKCHIPFFRSSAVFFSGVVLIYFFWRTHFKQNIRHHCSSHCEGYKSVQRGKMSPLLQVLFFLEEASQRFDFAPTSGFIAIGFGATAQGCQDKTDTIGMTGNGCGSGGF